MKKLFLILLSVIYVVIGKSQNVHNVDTTTTAVQTLSDTADIVVTKYPVLVYDINGNLLGRAYTSWQLMAIWSGSPINSSVGQIVKGVDSFHYIIIPFHNRVIAADSFSVKGVSNLVAWYDISSRNNLVLSGYQQGFVDSVYDLSGNGHTLYQTDTTQAPFYFPSGGLNDMAYMNTKGRNIWAHGISQNQPFRIYMAVRQNSFNDLKTVFRYDSTALGNGLIQHYNLDSSLKFLNTDANNQQSNLWGFTYRPGDATVISATFDSAHLATGIRVNDELFQYGSSASGGNKMNTIYFGIVDADFEEMIVTSGTPTAAQDRQIRRYLINKWGPRKQKVVAFFGDSQTAGYGVVSGHSFVTWTTILDNIVAYDLGVPTTTVDTVNGVNGVPGKNFNDIYNAYTDSLTYYKKSCYVIVQYGTNEALTTPTNAWYTTYKTDLSNIISKGYDPRNVIICTPPYNDARPGLVAFNTKIKQIANELRIKLYDGYNYTFTHGGESLIGPDSIHLNDLGHKTYAQGLLAVMHQSYRPDFIGESPNHTDSTLRGNGTMQDPLRADSGSCPTCLATGYDLSNAVSLGVTAFGSVGSSPNANGATISGSTATLQPSDSTHPGLITVGAIAQKIGGPHIWTGLATFDSTTTVAGNFNIGVSLPVGTKDPTKGLQFNCNSSQCFLAGYGGSSISLFMTSLSQLLAPPIVYAPLIHGGFAGGGADNINLDASSTATAGNVNIGRGATTKDTVNVSLLAGLSTDSLVTMITTSKGKQLRYLPIASLPTSYTFTNGLTNTSGTVALGGTLTGTTNINGASNLLALGTSGSVLAALNINSTGALQYTGGSYNNTLGSQLLIQSSTVNNPITAASGTVANWAATWFGGSTITSTNTGITYTNAATLWIDAAPTASTNSTITNQYSLYNNSGSPSYFKGTILPLHIGGNSSTPTTNTLGTNVTSATVTGNDNHFKIVLVTSGAIAGTLCTVNFGSTWSSTPVCVISSADATTGGGIANTTGGYIAFNGVSTTQGQLVGAITAAGTYTFNIICGN